MTIMVEHGAWALFFAFVIVHAIADYPLQGPWLAENKVRGSDAGGNWWIAMVSHSLVHAGGVWWVSGSPVLGVVELVSHFVIDHGKGAGWYGMRTDQLLHVLCKAAYVVFLLTAA